MSPRHNTPPFVPCVLCSLFPPHLMTGIKLQYFFSAAVVADAAEGDYSNNTCTDNKYGFRWSVGASYNKIYDNQVYDSTQCEFSEKAPYQ